MVGREDAKKEGMVNSKMRIVFKRPSYGRRSFRICILEPGSKWQTLNTEEIRSLNEKFLSCEISYSECEKEFKNIVDSIYKARDSHADSYLQANKVLLDEYYAFKYLKKSRQRRLAKSTIQSAYNDLTRAILSIGDLDLRYAPIEKIQERTDSYFEDKPNVIPHTKAVMRLNALMRFCGRPLTDVLESMPEEHYEVKNLGHDEFLQVLEYLDPICRALSSIAYYTGLRIGEIFALKRKNLTFMKDGISLNIASQMYRDGSYGLPKRRKVRRTFGFIECKKDLLMWVTIDEQERLKLRQRKFWREVKLGCKAADVSQEISFKDWRHCYAINLLNNGATLSQVAQNLGNSEQVCRKHYTGFVMTHDGIERMADLVKNSFEGY